jgi:multicomponent Na+:H+ antiporter subunit B
VIVPLDLVLFLILITTAVLALVVEDLLAAVALLSAYSLFAALLFAGVLAIDVALVEAALGAGLTGVLFIATILATTRRDPRRRLVVIPAIGAFVLLMLFASGGLPDRGDPQAPAQTGVSTHYLANSLAETQTPNVVTAILADYRSQDTLGETLVILTAALAASVVLARRLDRPDESTDEEVER